MVAYRLHFERANLEAGEIARSGRIGEPRLFNSTFCTPVVPGNIRVRRDAGGGVLYDIGIYCINAARALFGDEPVEVRAAAAGKLDEVEESVSAVLRFPNERVAAFSASASAPPRSPSTASRAPRATSRSSPRTTTRARSSTASRSTARRASGASPSATSSRPSCSTFPTACCRTARPSPAATRALPTCA